jgi:hypothetical protein
MGGRIDGEADDVFELNIKPSTSAKAIAAMMFLLPAQGHRLTTICKIAGPAVPCVGVGDYDCIILGCVVHRKARRITGVRCDHGVLENKKSLDRVGG